MNKDNPTAMKILKLSWKIPLILWLSVIVIYTLAQLCYLIFEFILSNPQHILITVIEIPFWVIKALVLTWVWVMVISTIEMLITESTWKKS